MPLCVCQSGALPSPSGTPPFVLRQRGGSVCGGTLKASWGPGAHLGKVRGGQITGSGGCRGGASMGLLKAPYPPTLECVFLAQFCPVGLEGLGLGCHQPETQLAERCEGTQACGMEPMPALERPLSLVAWSRVLPCLPLVSPAVESRLWPCCPDLGLMPLTCSCCSDYPSGCPQILTALLGGCTESCPILLPAPATRVPAVWRGWGGGDAVLGRSGGEGAVEPGGVPAAALLWDLWRLQAPLPTSRSGSAPRPSVLAWLMASAEPHPSWEEQWVRSV